MTRPVATFAASSPLRTPLRRVRLRLDRALYRAQRAAVRCWGLALLALPAGLVATGALSRTKTSASSTTAVMAVAAMALLVVGRLATWLGASRAASRPAHALAHADRAAAHAGTSGGGLLAEIELGAALAVATYLAVALTGASRSPLSPLIYLLGAFALTFLARPAALATLGLCAALEIGLAVATDAPPAAPATHLLFLALFAAAHATFLRGEVTRLRRLARNRVGDEIRSLRDEARDFRLIGSSLGADSRTRSREDEKEKLAQGAVETIHQTLFFTLELLKTTLDLHTCLLLWLDDSGEHLKIKELVTDSDVVVETPIRSDAGAPGAVVRERLAVNLASPKRAHLPYYSAPPREGIGAFFGVPVEEDGHLRGVLCADRSAAAPFGPREEQLLAGAARHILRAIQSERVFGAVERSKYEHERFFRAAEMLGKALTLQQVYETTFQAAREIVSFDFGAISLYDKETRRHTIQHVQGDSAEELAGVTYSDSAGLAAMAVKNKHYLPAGGELKDKGTPVFKAKIKLKGMESLLVMPLICADEAIGSLTLAARARGAFPDDKREMLGVIATQVAFSVENAKMYRRMEEMATTDGLTGLLNHRTFQERLTEMLGRAERHQKPVTLLLTDIDHFKKVNDTYGHPTGDAVLKRVAQVLAAAGRKIDLVARYGGEEFALVLEESDARGARQLADRIRAEVQACEFASEKGPFHVTLSIGIATYPVDAKAKAELVSNADQCLYYAKEHGRNQAVAWAELLAAKAKRPRSA